MKKLTLLITLLSLVSCGSKDSPNVQDLSVKSTKVSTKDFSFVKSEFEAQCNKNLTPEMLNREEGESIHPHAGSFVEFLYDSSFYIEYDGDSPEHVNEEVSLVESEDSLKELLEEYKTVELCENLSNRIATYKDNGYKIAIYYYVEDDTFKSNVVLDLVISMKPDSIYLYSKDMLDHEKLFENLNIELFNAKYDINTVKNFSTLAKQKSLKHVSVYLDSSEESEAPFIDLAAIQFENVEFLSIMNIGVKNVNALANLSNLKELELLSSKIKNFPISLSKLPRLERLTIDSHEFESFGVDTLTGFNSLEYLGLGKLSFSDLEKVATLPSIEYVYSNLESSEEVDNFAEDWNKKYPNIKLDY